MVDRISALRRTLPVAVVVALAAVAAPAVAQAPSGTGSKNAGESANIWDGFLGFLGWVLLALGVAGFLVWMMLGRRRDEDAASPAPAAPSPARPPASGPPDAARAPAAAASGDPAPATRDLVVLAFARADGAERAFGAVCGPSPGGAPWARDLAFVEGHHRGRIVVRGTFAGHWVDVENVAASAREGTAEGAVAETVVGVAFGPPAFAGHLAAGGSPAERAALLDTVRAALPEESSGIVALVAPPDADAMIAAFDDRATRVSRHRLAPEEAAALEAAVAAAPPAGPGPQPSSSIS